MHFSRLAVMAVIASFLMLSGCSASTDAGGDDGNANEESAEHVDEAEDPLATGSCARDTAVGAVVVKQRALLHTIAWAEGTLGTCGQDGYSTGFSFNCFSSCKNHPKTVWRAGGYSSSAAGRYQFLTATWASLRLPTFSPANQDRGAMKLIAGRRVTVPRERPLTATEFANAVKLLGWEWASLPGSPYGQPVKKLGEVRAKYCGFAGC